jgi:Flp pilus assembly pilin Flp
MRRRRTRGAAAAEYVIVLVIVLLAGVGVTMNLQRTIKCKMTESPGHRNECDGTASVRLTTSDDGCIGVVCQPSP